MCLIDELLIYLLFVDRVYWYLDIWLGKSVQKVELEGENQTFFWTDYPSQKPR